MFKFLLSLSLVTLLTTSAAAQNPNLIVYQGDNGPGKGKHIVFLAGDHEYRSEESLPALARILAKHYGFKCSVFFTTDPKTGFIEPGSSNISGLEALKTADLLVVFLRFQDFPDDQMQHIADYLDRGGPVVGFRTATHAFQIKRADAKFRKFDWQNKDDFPGGFGRQILGETWVSHYGTNHKQSSRLLLQADELTHPILRGVKDVHVQSGGYTANPIEGSHILARGQVTRGDDAGLAGGERQGTDAGRVVSNLHEHVWKSWPGVYDDARRVGGPAERGLPSHERQRDSLGSRAGTEHQARQRHQPGRPFSPIDVCLRRFCQRSEAGRHGRVGLGDTQVGCQLPVSSFQFDLHF